MNNVFYSRILLLLILAAALRLLSKNQLVERKVQSGLLESLILCLAEWILFDYGKRIFSLDHRGEDWERCKLYFFALIIWNKKYYSLFIIATSTFYYSKLRQFDFVHTKNAYLDDQSCKNFQPKMIGRSNVCPTNDFDWLTSSRCISVPHGTPFPHHDASHASLSWTTTAGILFAGGLGRTGIRWTATDCRLPVLPCPRAQSTRLYLWRVDLFALWDLSMRVLLDSVSGKIGTGCGSLLSKLQLVAWLLPAYLTWHY